jgi:hypothetical protein
MCQRRRHAGGSLDQNAPFAGRAFSSSFYQNLPFGRRETVCQQRALASAI